MYSTRWQTSKRQYGVRMERNVSIPVRAGFTLDCHIARPDAPGKFPAIVSIHPFDNDRQFEPMMPKGHQGIAQLRDTAPRRADPEQAQIDHAGGSEDCGYREDMKRLRRRHDPQLILQDFAQRRVGKPIGERAEHGEPLTQGGYSIRKKSNSAKNWNLFH